MALNNTECTVEFAGDGTTVFYTTPFPVLKGSHLMVSVVDSEGRETVLTPAVDYEVIIGSDVANRHAPASVTLTNPQPLGNTVRIARVVPLVQEAILSNQGGAQPKTVEQQLDYQMMVDQQQEMLLQKSVGEIGEVQDSLAQEIQDRTDGDAALATGVEKALQDAAAANYLATQAQQAAVAARAAADEAERFAQEAAAAAGVAVEDAKKAVEAVGSKADASELAKYLPLAGGTVNGTLRINDGTRGIIWLGLSQSNISSESTTDVLSLTAGGTQLNFFVNGNVQVKRLGYWNGIDLFLLDSNGTNPVGVRTTLVGIRKPLAANLSIYIRTDGSDANDGVSAPIKTFSKLRAVLASFDFKGKNCTINIGPGIWNEQLYLSASDLYGCRSLSIVGSGSQQTKVINDATSIDLGVGQLGGVRNRMNGIGVGGGSGGIVVTGGSHFLMDDIDFGEVNTNAMQLYIHSGAQVDFWDTRVSISGGGLTHLRCATGGRCLYNYASVTIKAASNFTSNIFDIIQQSFLSIYGATFTNKNLVTGRRFNVREMSGINTGGSGDSFLPGSLPGVVDSASGGFYG